MRAVLRLFAYSAFVIQLILEAIREIHPSLMTAQELPDYHAMQITSLLFAILAFLFSEPWRKHAE